MAVSASCLLAHMLLLLWRRQPGLMISVPTAGGIPSDPFCCCGAGSQGC